MVSIESSGKTVREAIEEGLKRLNKSLGEVEVKILSQGGLLRKAKVQITAAGSTQPDESDELNIDYLGPKRQRSEEENLEREKRYQSYSENIKIPDENSQPPKKARNEQKPFKKSRQENLPDNAKRQQHKRTDEQSNERSNERGDERRQERRPRREEVFSPLNEQVKQRASGFLTGALTRMGINHTLNVTETDNQLGLDIVCESGAAIGYRGETLSALEYLTCLCVSRGSDRYKIAVDCNGYREKREQSLVALAERMAQKALKTGRKVVLEPMSSPSRKVIHSVLADNNKLITRSEGNEPNRRIVIIPKRNKPQQKGNQLAD